MFSMTLSVRATGNFSWRLNAGPREKAKVTPAQCVVRMRHSTSMKGEGHRSPVEPGRAPADDHFELAFDDGFGEEKPADGPDAAAESEIFEYEFSLARRGERQRSIGSVGE
jgi:hypothetical protein